MSDDEVCMIKYELYNQLHDKRLLMQLLNALLEMVSHTKTE
jgi:hypothetical protein